MDDAGSTGGAGDDASMPTQLQPLAQDCKYLELLRADATHLYWACNPGTTIRRMPLEGGPIETLYTGPGYAMGLAIDGGFVYVAQSRGGSFNYADLVVRVPVTGGAPLTLVAPTGVRALDVDGGWVYYSDTPDFPARVMRVSINGGNPHFLVRSRANSTPYELIADAGVVFYTDARGVMRLEAQTKRLTELVPDLFTTEFTIDDQFVYFIGCASSGCADARAYRVPRSGGSIEPLGSGHAARSQVDAIDDKLMWGSHLISTSGGPEQTLLASQEPFAVVATPQAYYFAEMATGTIYRVAR